MVEARLGMCQGFDVRKWMCAHGGVDAGLTEGRHNSWAECVWAGQLCSWQRVREGMWRCWV